MKNLKVILSFLIASSFLLTACSNQSNVNTDESQTVLAKGKISTTSVPKNSKTNKNANITLKTKINSYEENEVIRKTKDYILDGQKDISESQKLNWSESFLNEVNIREVYKNYLATGGKRKDVQSFAEYLTQKAPVLSDWKQLFEADLLKEYGVKVSRYESLNNNLYQVYVKIDGSEVRYVVVNARTGYFHG